MALFLNTYCDVPHSPANLTLKENTKPNFGDYFTIASQYSNIRSFVFVGEDLSFVKAIYLALGKYQTTKHVFFLEQADPSDIAYVRDRCHVHETLIVAIDPTGDSPNVIKTLLALDHQKLILCPEKSALKKYQEGHDLAYYPYTKEQFCTTSTGVLLPTVLLFMNAQEVHEGAQHIARRCHPQSKDNPALKLARCLKGKTPNIQHFGNKLLGASIVTSRHIKSEGPEELTIPIIAQQSEEDIRISVPFEFKKIPYKEGTLADLEGASLHQEQVMEFENLCKNAKTLSTITIDAIDPHSIGELLLFWEYVKLYTND